MFSYDNNGDGFSINRDSSTQIVNFYNLRKVKTC